MAFFPLKSKERIVKKKEMFPAGFEPATFRGRDNHYTTETTQYKVSKARKYKNFLSVVLTFSVAHYTKKA